jgi:hypothetical protein
LKRQGNNLKHGETARRRGYKPRKYVPNGWIDDQIRRIYQERADKRLSSLPNLKQLAKKLGWPHWAVKKRGRELGLARTKETPWSERELKLLERWAHLCPARVSRKLKAFGFARSEIAVNLKLKRMRLRQNTPYYSANQLAGLFGIDQHLVTKWIKLGYLRAIMKGTARTPQQGGDTYLVHHKDVRLFVVQHPMECDLRKVDQLWFIDLLINKKGA